MTTSGSDRSVPTFTPNAAVTPATADTAESNPEAGAVSPPAGEEVAEWSIHEDGRWVVGDAGRQPSAVVLPSSIAATRPDTVLDGAQLGDLDYRAVSLRGLSHRQTGKPRQDAYLLRVSSNQQWLIGCVADGVSSGEYSHIAADLACRDITRVLADAFGDQAAVHDQEEWEHTVNRMPWQHAIDQASAAIVARANKGFSAEGSHAAPVQREAREVRAVMATTAVAFVVGAARMSGGSVPCAVAVASGDSSALILSGGRWHPITSVKNADVDIASSAVLALPREVHVEPSRGALRPGEALAVISDGIGDPLGQGTGVVGRFLAAKWSRPPELISFAEHAAFYRRTFTDDRTAALVWHRPDAGQGTANGHPPLGVHD